MSLRHLAPVTLQREPRSPHAGRLSGGVLRRVGADWVFDTDVSAIPGGYVLFTGGNLVADDAATTGLRLLKQAPGLTAY